MSAHVGRRIAAFDQWLAVARLEGLRNLPPRDALHALARNWDGRPLDAQFGHWGTLLAHIMLACDAGHPQPLEVAVDSVCRNVSPAYPGAAPAPDRREPTTDPDSGSVRERLTTWLSRKGISLPEGTLAQLTKAGANEKDVARRLPTSYRQHAAEISQLLRESPTTPAQPVPPAGGPPRQRPPAPSQRPEPGPALAAGPAQPVAPAPAPTPQPTVDQRGILASLDNPEQLLEAMSGFAAMMFEEIPDPIDRVPLRVAQGQGGMRLTWPALNSDDQVVLLRVVSAENEEPLSPDHADPVAIVTGTVAYDRRPLRSAVRHYQVWANIGTTEEEAYWAEPQLYASASMVAPPWDLEIRPEGGSVIGKWTVAPGITEVTVTRVPSDCLSTAALQNPQNRVDPSNPHLNGCVDSHVEPGKGYLYRIVATASVGGALLRSQPVDRRLVTQAQLVPVTDLDVELDPASDKTTFTLRWTPPVTGAVEIYRTHDRPMPPTGETSPEILPQAGLPEQDRLIHPAGPAADGRAEMRAVPSRQGWSRVYFTPVTFLEGQAVVGSIVSVVVPGRISSAVVVDRGHSQIITLGWPEGASAVNVHLAPQSVPVAEATKVPPAFQLSQQQYRLQGGIHFSEPLNPNGTEIHLVPVSYDAEGAVEGPPYTLSYAGSYRVHYTVEAQGRIGSMLNTGKRVLRLWSNRNFPSITFVLVFNPERIPLHVDDGVIVHLSLLTESGQPQQPQRSITTRVGPDLAESWITDLGNERGWIRLFAVQLSPAQRAVFCLVDPEPGKLWRR